MFPRRVMYLFCLLSLLALSGFKCGADRNAITKYKLVFEAVETFAGTYGESHGTFLRIENPNDAGRTLRVLHHPEWVTVDSSDFVLGANSFANFPLTLTCNDPSLDSASSVLAFRVSYTEEGRNVHSTRNVNLDIECQYIPVMIEGSGVLSNTTSFLAPTNVSYNFNVQNHNAASVSIEIGVAEDDPVTVNSRFIHIPPAVGVEYGTASVNVAVGCADTPGANRYPIKLTNHTAEFDRLSDVYALHNCVYYPLAVERSLVVHQPLIADPVTDLELRTYNPNESAVTVSTSTSRHDGDWIDGLSPFPFDLPANSDDTNSSEPIEFDIAQRCQDNIPVHAAIVTESEWQDPITSAIEITCTHDALEVFDTVVQGVFAGRGTRLEGDLQIVNPNDAPVEVSITSDQPWFALINNSPYQTIDPYVTAGVQHIPFTVICDRPTVNTSHTAKVHVRERISGFRTRDALVTVRCPLAPLQVQSSVEHSMVADGSTESVRVRIDNYHQAAGFIRVDRVIQDASSVVNVNRWLVDVPFGRQPLAANGVTTINLGLTCPSGLTRKTRYSADIELVRTFDETTPDASSASTHYGTYTVPITLTCVIEQDQLVDVYQQDLLRMHISLDDLGGNIQTTQLGVFHVNNFTDEPLIVQVASNVSWIQNRFGLYTPIYVADPGTDTDEDTAPPSTLISYPDKTLTATGHVFTLSPDTEYLIGILASCPNDAVGSHTGQIELTDLFGVRRGTTRVEVTCTLSGVQFGELEIITDAGNTNVGVLSAINPTDITQYLRLQDVRAVDIGTRHISTLRATSDLGVVPILPQGSSDYRFAARCQHTTEMITNAYEVDFYVDPDIARVNNTTAPTATAQIKVVCTPDSVFLVHDENMTPLHFHTYHGYDYFPYGFEIHNTSRNEVDVTLSFNPEDFEPRRWQVTFGTAERAYQRYVPSNTRTVPRRGSGLFYIWFACVDERSQRGTGNITLTHEFSDSETNIPFTLHCHTQPLRRTYTSPQLVGTEEPSPSFNYEYPDRIVVDLISPLRDNPVPVDGHVDVRVESFHNLFNTRGVTTQPWGHIVREGIVDRDTEEDESDTDNSDTDTDTDEDAPPEPETLATVELPRIGNRVVPVNSTATWKIDYSCYVPGEYIFEQTLVNNDLRYLLTDNPANDLPDSVWSHRLELRLNCLEEEANADQATDPLQFRYR